jgi:hypothetical protein
MFENEGESAEISFQWVIGDTRALEKNFIELSRPKYYYAIIVFSRLFAYALTFAVAYLMLPDANFQTILWIAIAGSLSIWASLGLETLAMRALDRLFAQDARRVGWNHIWLDHAGISWSTETAEEYTSWLGVLEVVERDGSFWLKTGPVHGYYIPPRVFASEEEVNDCRQLIRRFRENPLPPRHLAGVEDDLVKH